MSAAKVAAHTPGPWQYVKGGAFNRERWGAIVHEDEDGGEHIAEICAADGVTDEADAALIAAAPDLLAALESAAKLVQTARQYFPKSVKHADRFALELTCADINAALAKVRS